MQHCTAFVLLACVAVTTATIVSPALYLDSPFANAPTDRQKCILPGVAVFVALLVHSLD